MTNPVIHRKKLTYYVLLWTVVTVIYFITGFFLFKQPLSDALIETLIFNGFLFAAGLGIWFVVHYIDIGIKNFTELVIAHGVVAGIISAIVLSLTNRFLGILPREGHEIDETALLPWRVMFVFLFYVLILLGYYLLKYQNSIAEKKQSEADLKNLLQETELNMLKAQINPHFVFNSLNSISSLTMTNPEKAQEMIVKLSGFLRFSLGKNNDEMVSLKEEIDNVMLYLDIEKVRFGNRIQIETDFEEQVMELKIPNLILQPLIENAIKHGLYENLGELLVSVKGKKHDEYLRLTLTNNFDESSGSTEKGIGLENVRKRLNLIYGNNAFVTTLRENHSFTVEIKINTKE